MDNTGYLSLAKAAMLLRKTDITANNIAGANTAGFRRSDMSFEEMVVNTHSGNEQMDKMSYAMDRGSYVDLREGSLEATGNDLDLAIQGNGFFAYQRDDGRIGLGRNGNLVRSENGDLTTASGDLILDIGGGPINIPADAGKISIGADGTVSNAAGAIVAQVGVFSEPGMDRWQKIDRGMMVPRDGEPALTAALDFKLRQGYVEKSNVEPVLEMTNLISQQRAYEQAMNLANMADDLRTQALQRFGRQA